MSRCNIGVMVGLGGIHAVLTGWLHRKEHISVHGAGHQDISFFGNHHVPRCLPPFLFHLFLCIGAQGVKEIHIVLSRKLLAFLCLFFGHHGNIIGGMGGHEFDKFFRCFRNEIDGIAIFLHPLHETNGTFHGIQAGSTAYVGILSRIIVENKGDFLMAVLHFVESCPFACLSHHAANPFGNRLEFHSAVFFLHSAGNGYAVNDAVQLRHGSSNGCFNGVKPFPVFPPFLFRNQECIGFKQGHPQLFQRIYTGLSASGEGKFHSTHQRINHRFSVFHEIGGNDVGQGGHAKAHVGRTIGKNRKYMVPLLFRFIYKSILVGQIPPDPFLPVKQETDDRLFVTGKLLEERRKVRGKSFFTVPVVNAGPGIALGSRRLCNGGVKQRRSIDPEIPEIFHAPIEAVFTEPLHHVIGKRTAMLRCIPIHGIYKVRNAGPIQKIPAVLPETGFQSILHQMDHNQRSAFHLPFPGPVPVTGAFQENRNAEV